MQDAPSVAEHRETTFAEAAQAAELGVVGAVVGIQALASALGSALSALDVTACAR